MRIPSLPAALVLAGLLQIAAVPADATTFDLQVDRGASASRYAAYTAEAAQRFRIPGAWIEAVLHVESAGNPRAVSPAGAIGLMQVMPGTWAGLRTRYRLGPDPFEPRDNILAGAAYLREMFDRYGDVSAMLAAYNAGPDRTDDYLAFGRPLPAETRAYVAAIAPVLGVAPLPGGTVKAAPTSDWRAAPLFVGRSEDAVGSAPDAALKPSDSDAGAGAEVADTAVDRPSEQAAYGAKSLSPEIFVARAEGEARR